jgi:aspartyl-tRNA(Asn)/glutamyl-tRNA(Gln) amidotransferase subunit A
VNEILAMGIEEVGRLLRKRDITAQALTRLFFERIERYDGEINAYLRLTEELAFARAEAADRVLAAGGGGPLTGIPFAIKDIFCTQGVETTCASQILKGFVPPYDATIIRKLNEAGYVHLGRVNMDEFAMGSSTENSSFQVTKNPWDRTRIPGGSSGGSTAAVSAGLCMAALGTDTGGSIRQPAALCGVVGLKPTYGRVSRYGLVAFASSLDQIGPLTRSVGDCAVVLNAIAGHDRMDSTSIPQPVPDYRSFLGRDIKGIRIGRPKEYYIEGMEPEVRQALEEGLRILEGQGAEIVGMSLPSPEDAVATYYVICTAEASSNLARYDGVKYGLRVDGKDIIDMYKKSRLKGFGKEVKRRVILGTYVLSSGYYDAYYRKAGKVRTLIRRDFEEAFKACDVIATPVSPTTAFRIGEKTDDPLTMYLSDIFTIPVNLAGLPGMSIPAGFDRAGLPIGLQLIGRPLDEGTMLQVAHLFETERKVKRIPDRYLA